MNCDHDPGTADASPLYILSRQHGRVPEFHNRSIFDIGIWLNNAVNDSNQCNQANITSSRKMTIYYSWLIKALV